MGVGGLGWKFLIVECPISSFYFPTKCSWGSKTHAQFFFRGGDFGVFGVPHAPTRGSRGVGKRYTSSYDHDM